MSRSFAPSPVPVARRVVAAVLLSWNLVAARGAAVDFAALEPLLQEHCVECHGAPDPEGGLVLESAVDLLKGGESGPAVMAGKGAESRLIQALEGRWGKTGKNQFMPPGKRARLKPEQVALFKSWIDGGAPLPTVAAAARVVTVPRVEPRGTPRRPINALAFDPASRLLAVARSDAVELVHADTRKVVRSLSGFGGAAHAVVFSRDGTSVYAGTGDPTGGEVRQWKTADGTPGRVHRGHKDAVHALAMSPDGRGLASGGYDYGIRLWNPEDGTVRATVAGGQGAIMDLAFRPDGRVFAGVGYDRTAKIYETASGNRLDTLGQALKELNAVAFSPDGTTLLTGGNDNRIRSYRLGADAGEGSNRLVDAVFAHEGAILRLVYSPDGRTVASAASDRTVKLFAAEGLKPRLTLEPQPDWPNALAFVGNEVLAVGRADGSLAFYQTGDGKPAPLPKAELLRTTPRGVERGTACRVRLEGRHLDRATVASVYRDGKFLGVQVPGRDGDNLFVTLEPPADEPVGPWEISVGTATEESGRVKVWIDDLPQLAVAADQTPTANLSMPVSVWSTLEKPGKGAEYGIAGKAGQHLVVDLWGQRLGARGDYNLTLIDPDGRALARSDHDRGQTEPLLLVTLPRDGTYRVRVGEATYSGSDEHYFRLSVGALPFVAGIFPPSIAARTETEVEVFGYNLGDGAHGRVKAGEPGEVGLPGVAGQWRSRSNRKFLVTAAPAPVEAEPNDTPAQAMPVPVPVSVNGRLPAAAGGGPDADLYRFTARRGATYVLETAAAQRGSPADTRLEVLWPDGRPVERVRLQAVRNSAVSFRTQSSDDAGTRFENWEEMEPNDLLWCGGEVMKLFRAPQGPDSDWVSYTSNGKRRGFFDTTPTAHYLDEPAYIVRPIAAGENPVPNGLPVFVLDTVNEDAALRDLGADSRIHFVAPADGAFLARVSDARGLGGPDFVYALAIREARPDFVPSVNGANPSVAAGSGQSFGLALKRIDGFEGAVRVAFAHMPAGWSVSGPLEIEAGHGSASGTLTAAPDAGQPTDAQWDAVTVTATAEIEGKVVTRPVANLGRPKLVRESPKLLVKLEPFGDAAGGGAMPPVLPLAPGGTTKARLSIVRQGFAGVVTFSVDNLPHGVIVENLGLNGITFLADETEREISLAAVKWMKDLDRPFFAVENQAGRQTSMPLLLRVRRN